jgi:predicted phosphate transport protein (TIGR00153 family)
MQKYLKTLVHCREAFGEGIYHFISSGEIDDTYLEFMARTHKYEGLADDIRDELEMRMYEQALIPESRGDVLALIENLDSLPNKLENIAKFVEQVNLRFPVMEEEELESFRGDLRRLVGIGLEAFDLALQSAEVFFNKPKNVREFSMSIDRKESEADHLEENLKCRIFRLDGFSDLQRFLFFKLVDRISRIADLALSFQRRIILLSLKSSY